MNIKSEKGITNIDIIVSIILITLFVAIIATLMYSINSNSKSVERRSEATNYAINTIEKIKATAFDDIDRLAGESDLENTGYHQKIIITDYAELGDNINDDTIVPGLVKKVTVEISYKDGNTTQTVDLSTVITNSN